MALRAAWLAAGLMAGGVASASGQDSVPLAVGDTAPDFTLQAATRAGVSQRLMRLSELRDKTVVIAFFYKARTSG